MCEGGRNGTYRRPAAERPHVEAVRDVERLVVAADIFVGVAAGVDVRCGVRRDGGLRCGWCWRGGV